MMYTSAYLRKLGNDITGVSWSFLKLILWTPLYSIIIKPLFFMDARRAFSSRFGWKTQSSLTRLTFYDVLFHELWAYTKDFYDKDLGKTREKFSEYFLNKYQDVLGNSNSHLKNLLSKDESWSTLFDYAEFTSCEESYTYHESKEKVEFFERSKPDFSGGIALSATFFTVSQLKKRFMAYTSARFALARELQKIYSGTIKTGLKKPELSTNTDDLVSAGFLSFMNKGSQQSIQIILPEFSVVNCPREASGYREIIFNAVIFDSYSSNPRLPFVHNTKAPFGYRQLQAHLHSDHVSNPFALKSFKRFFVDLIPALCYIPIAVLSVLTKIVVESLYYALIVAVFAIVYAIYPLIFSALFIMSISFNDDSDDRLFTLEENLATWKRYNSIPPHMRIDTTELLLLRYSLLTLVVTPLIKMYGFLKSRPLLNINPFFWIGFFAFGYIMIPLSIITYPLWSPLLGVRAYVDRVNESADKPQGSRGLFGDDRSSAAVNPNGKVMPKQSKGGPAFFSPPNSPIHSDGEVQSVYHPDSNNPTSSLNHVSKG